MKICFVIADNDKGEKLRELELERLRKFIAQLKTVGISSYILLEILDEKINSQNVNVGRLDEAVIWEYRRPERTENYLFCDPHFDDILYKFVWEHAFDIVHLFFSEGRCPTSLATTASFLGPKLVISSSDFAFICPERTLIDSDRYKCRGPETFDKCANCMACGDFSRFFGSKHRAILWNELISKVLSSANLITSSNADVMQLMSELHSLDRQQISSLDWPLAGNAQQGLAQEYAAAYQLLLNPQTDSAKSASLSLVIPAFEEWIEPRTNFHVIHHLNYCLMSLAVQASKLGSQIVVALDQKYLELAQQCAQRFTNLKINFLLFKSSPNLSTLLSSVSNTVANERVILLPVDRTYSPNYLEAHARTHTATQSDYAYIGLTAWPHATPLTPLEEFVLSQSTYFRIDQLTVKLNKSVPWQGVSFASKFLRQILPNQATLAGALGVEMPIFECRQALSAVSESITAERWISMAMKKAHSLNNHQLSRSEIEQIPTPDELRNPTKGSLAELRMLGFATIEGIVPYGEMLHRALKNISPGLWLSRN